jgi:uncharacterized protein (TIGR04255 family)
MIWQIDKKKRQVFDRNPLSNVVVQLRFRPILRIGEGKGVADFQELVRQSFPGYVENEIRNFTIDIETQVSTKREKAFQFIRPEDECKVQLSSDNVLIETTNHRNRDNLIRDMEIVTNALTEVFSPINTQRLGVRYINVIRKDVISQDLGRPTTWANLVSDEYLRMPAEIADLDKTIFANQVSSPMPFGAMTLRYGLVRPNFAEPATFNFDLDRYVDEGIEIDKIPSIMTQFTDDIFSLFNTLPGIDLIEWMSNKGKAAQSEEVH